MRRLAIALSILIPLALLCLASAKPARAGEPPAKQVVVFTRAFCLPCLRVKTELRKLGSEYDVTIYDVNSDRDLARFYGVKLTPTVILYARGRFIGRCVGETTAEAIRDRFERRSALHVGRYVACADKAPKPPAKVDQKKPGAPKKAPAKPPAKKKAPGKKKHRILGRIFHRRSK